MENEEKTENKEEQEKEQDQTEREQRRLKEKSEPGFERTLGRMKKALWMLAIFAALICAFSVVNVMIARKVLDGVQRHLVSLVELKESLKEIQKTSNQLKRMIEELSETQEEEGNQADQGEIWNGRI